MGGGRRRDDTVARVEAIAAGQEMAAHYAALASRGDAAIDAVSRVFAAGCPAGRHRNDWDADLVGVYIHVADHDPAPLVARVLAADPATGDLMYALGQCSHPDIGAALGALLDDGRREVRKGAAIALGRRGDPRALEPLLELLRGRYLDFAVLQAVANFDDPRVVEPLEALLARPRPAGVERVARETLARVRGA